MVLSARLLQPVAIWEGALTPMMRSTLDGAFWFVERADSVGVSLSNRKLQSLLYLAQAHFANANGGRRLMPQFSSRPTPGRSNRPSITSSKMARHASSTPCPGPKSKPSSARCGGGMRNCPMMIWRVKSLKTGTIEAPMPRGGCTKYVLQALAVTRTRRWSKPPRPVGPRQ